MTKYVKINNRVVGPGQPVYVIAELSANHGQDFNKAAELIKIAKDSGADAVKIQTYTPDTITIDCNKSFFKIKGKTIWDGRTLYDLYGEAYTPWEWQPKLKKIADKLKIDLFSTPFDPSSVDFLKKMNVPAYKVASFELVDIPLIKKIARQDKPVIISTGMATVSEIRDAVKAILSQGNRQIAILKCTSGYPADPKDMNLLTIPDMRKKFGTVVGLSDHSLGIAASISAVSLGASIIEKHIAISRKEPGPDSAFSLEPDEFKDLVKEIRIAEASLGKVKYRPSKSEEKMRIFRRSLFAVANIKAGEKFTSTNIRSIRPGQGLHPKFIDEIIGKKANSNISRGTPLSWKLIRK
ncbi:MAG TPA: pseudaminic acid synthase [Victivallales bacterium]|nr:pseudaminic acid synthase [Victivallales bacterium]